MDRRVQGSRLLISLVFLSSFRFAPELPQKSPVRPSAAQGHTKPARSYYKSYSFGFSQMNVLCRIVAGPRASSEEVTEFVDGMEGRSKAIDVQLYSCS